MKTITIPHNYEPRPYQLPTLKAIDGKYKRLICLWHRRAGKDKTWVNIVAKKALERKGSYYFLFPTYEQGNKIIWTGMDKDGFKFLDHFPKEIVKRKDNTRMLVELINGSIVQIVGTDKIDSIVGTNPVGCIFSEYAVQDPQAWDFLRPILAENGGWAAFIYTPRGQNHGYDLFQYAIQHPDDWFVSKLTVEDTKIIDQATLDREREEIIAKNGDDALFYQEYYCSFEAPRSGAYYAKQLQQAIEDKRIGSVPWEPAVPVHTAWDLGINDAMSIWFVQQVGKEIRVIDYYENSGEGLLHYIKHLQSKPYVYGTHYAPHDIEVKELGTGKSRLEVARGLGITFQVVAQMGVMDGVEAVRNILSRCWFDGDKCKRGLDALKSYHKDYDEKRMTYRSQPVHDWSSHGADAFRYLAVGIVDAAKKVEAKPVPHSYNPARPYVSGAPRHRVV